MNPPHGDSPVCEPCEPSRSRKTGGGLPLGWACQLRKSSRSTLLEQSYFISVATIPSTLPEYRREDWKHWTDSDRDCQDARNEVLIEESLTTVTFRTDDGCRVATGQWLAPYTNTVVTDPGMIDDN